eukprot:scaffold7566_cov122-Isochrysis_galbana.AAC.8
MGVYREPGRRARHSTSPYRTSVYTLQMPTPFATAAPGSCAEIGPASRGCRPASRSQHSNRTYATYITYRPASCSSVAGRSSHGMELCNGATPTHSAAESEMETSHTKAERNIRTMRSGRLETTVVNNTTAGEKAAAYTDIAMIAGMSARL